MLRLERAQKGFFRNLLGLKVVKTPVRSPKANSLCERLIGTLRRECLKKEYLKEFKSRNSYTEDELKDLSKVVRQVNARLKGGATS